MKPVQQELMLSVIKTVEAKGSAPTIPSGSPRGTSRSALFCKSPLGSRVVLKGGFPGALEGREVLEDSVSYSYAVLKQ